MVHDNGFGATTWDIELNQPAAGRSNKDLYMRLKEGKNSVRIVTRPHQYMVHNYKEDGDPGFGEKIKCSADEKGASCPLCAMGNRPKRRWFVGVIDRDSGSYKILDISYAVFQSIQSFSRTEDYGDPQRYDIDIIVNKKAGPTGYYSIVPRVPKALSSTDVEIKAKVDIDELQRLCSPLTPEKVQERLNNYLAKRAGQAPAAASGKGKAATQKVDLSSVDEPDFTFPQVQS